MYLQRGWGSKGCPGGCFNIIITWKERRCGLQEVRYLPESTRKGLDEDERFKKVRAIGVGEVLVGTLKVPFSRHQVFPLVKWGPLLRCFVPPGLSQFVL